MTKQVTDNNIVFLHHEETYEVRKNQTGTIKYYTRIDTGESGMSLRGLANACGVGDKSLKEFLDTTTIFEEVRGKIDKNELNNLNKNKKEVRGKLNIYLIQTNDVHVICDIFCERVIFYSVELSIEEQLKRENEALKLQLAEQTEEIRKLKYQPIYEKTHQAHLYAQWGGICLN